MPKEVSWAPGAVAPATNIDLPAGSPAIDRVISASITRIPSAVAAHSHTALQIAAADGIRNAAAGDDLQALRDGAGNALAATMEISRGGPAAGGGTQSVPTSSDALAGANPVVAATPTRVDENTITLDVATTLGDVLTLIYGAVGERVVP